MSDAIEKPLKKMAQPIQNLINLNAILGKPSGGTRTVCKTPMIYRITLRSRNTVAEWEDLMTGDFDTSGKGKSALIAAAYRGLQAEIYKYTEEQVIGVFHDFEKFFDTIDLEILMQKALEHNFPIIDLALTMQQHMAPRIIQCDGFCSRTIITNTSILAGCKHSVALTRLLFLTGMKQLSIENPLAAPQVYVYDTAMITAGDKDTTLTNMAKAIKDFAKMSSKLGLTLSTKGVIVAKLPYAARHLVQDLKTLGITYNTAETTRDLGIDFSFSRKPKIRKCILKQRIQKSKGTLNRIYRIAKVTRRARVLFSGAGYSKSTWGQQASAITLQEWSKIEVAAVNAASFGKGRCRYSALCIAYGPEGQPFTRAIKETFILWFKLILPLIKQNSPILIHIEESWNQIYKDMKLQDTKITLEKGLARADGIAAHITVILYSLQWKPIQYDTWEDPQGNTWQLHADFDRPFPMMTVIHAIIDSYHEYMAPNAAKHFDGASITGAIAWETTLAHNQTLKKKKKFPELAILETIQAGACWPCNRVNDVLDKDTTCALCGQQYTDQWHTYWTCPSLQESEDEAITKSQKLIAELNPDKK